MPNALAASKSPYLRQHADHPVDWREWSDEAFAEARARGVPVLVSIGYATCHWCHVMAHESFEDAEVAALMNRCFVNIKVDREERPEVDEIYMDAVQALHGHGGWPLNAFVDDRGRPFFAGTYFPRERWLQILAYLADLYTHDRERVLTSADELTRHLTSLSGSRPQGPLPAPEQLWRRLAQDLDASWDPAHPGLRMAPKFPPSQWLVQELQRPPGPHARLDQAIEVLEAMQDSGLHDRVGGGFHRYATDREWRVPHFEKMLYDQAQLGVAYALAAQRTGRPDFRRTALALGDYLLRDLRVEDGAFQGYASAEDADDPGGEGSFYAWSPDDLRAALGSEAEALITAWDLAPGEREIGPSGHLEPVTRHIPHPRAHDLEALARRLGFADTQGLRASWEPHLPRLRELRAARPRPIRDDKVLTDLNGLALELFATLASLEPRFFAPTRELAEVLRARVGPTQVERLPGLAGFVTDYGHLATGLVAAFRALGDPSLFTLAARVVELAAQHLRADDGGFYTTPAGRGDLIRRSREHHDGAYPAGQHSLARAAIALYQMSHEPRWRALAEGVFAAQARMLDRAPTACATLLLALLEVETEPATVVVTGPPEAGAELLAVARGLLRPSTFVVEAERCAAAGLSLPLLGERLGRPVEAHVCVGTRCLLPVTTPEALRRALAEL